MNRLSPAAAILTAALAAAAISPALVTSETGPHRPINGTIWAANRGDHSIRGFDGSTGAVVQTVPMRAGSQPGDLAAAKGRVYVAEEFGEPPAIAIVDPEAGAVVDRIFLPAGSRPHHVHASSGGNLVAAALFGTDMVAVIDTRDDSLLGPWDSNPLTVNGRVHAAVFSQDGNTLYLTVEGANEVVAIDPRTGWIFWRMSVPAAHELAVTHEGKTAYVTRRTANRVAVIDLETQTFTDVLSVSLPDTLRLSANEKLLTVGLRSSPAQLAVVDTRTFAVDLVTLNAQAMTIAGHQWTSPSGRFTFASFEGGSTPGVAVIDHAADNAVVQVLDYPGRPHGVDHLRP